MKRSKRTDKHSLRTSCEGRPSGGRGRILPSKKHGLPEVFIDARSVRSPRRTKIERSIIKSQLLTQLMASPDGIHTCNGSCAICKASKSFAQIAMQLKPELKTSSGRKYDNGKPRLELLSPKALTEIAKVMTFGAQKYDAHNWRGGIAWSRVLGAALRHISAFNDGVDKDPETGLSHLAHAGCCIMFLLEYEATHTDLDDRYKGGNK
jgi:hypothetical protein